MRDDLNKLICERERVGHSKKFKDVRHNKKFKDLGIDGENLSARESMKHRHTRGGDTKSFNENLNPLWGNIRKAVGKKWDSFYSDLCKNFDKRSVINQHILEHLDDYVQRNLDIVDNELIVRGKYGMKDTLLKDSYVEYYVDPRDGILKKNKWLKTFKQSQRLNTIQANKELLEKYRQIDNLNVLHKIDGVWFHFTLKEIPKGQYVFTKPKDVDTFIVSAKHGKPKTWDQLKNHEKAKIGIKTFKGESGHDLLTDARYFNDGTRTRCLFHGSHNGEWNLPKKYYHATKQSASHKMLKKADVI